MKFPSDAAIRSDGFKKKTRRKKLSIYGGGVDTSARRWWHSSTRLRTTNQSIIARAWWQLKRHTCQVLTKTNENVSVDRLGMTYANDMQIQFNRPLSKWKWNYIKRGSQLWRVIYANGQLELIKRLWFLFQPINQTGVNHPSRFVTQRLSPFFYFCSRWVIQIDGSSWKNKKIWIIEEPSGSAVCSGQFFHRSIRRPFLLASRCSTAVAELLAATAQHCDQ